MDTVPPHCNLSLLLLLLIMQHGTQAQLYYTGVEFASQLCSEFAAAERSDAKLSSCLSQARGALQLIVDRNPFLRFPWLPLTFSMRSRGTKPATSPLLPAPAPHCNAVYIHRKADAAVLRSEGQPHVVLQW